MYDLFWSDALRKWVDEQRYPGDTEGEPACQIDHFDLDMVGVGGWFDVMPIRGYSEIVEETEEWKAVRNGAGAVLKWWKNKSGTPEHVDFRMTSRDIWERDYRPPLLEIDRARLETEKTREDLKRRKADGRWTFYGSLFIWELMRCSMGDLCMYESLLTDPDWIHDYNRVYTDFFKEHYRVLIEEGGKPDGIWLYEDLGYSQGLFCSPDTLEALIFPYYAELVDFFHGYDLPVVLHSCGGVTEALPQVVKAGFDGLNPMEVKAGCDLLKFADLYGESLTFFGGLDVRVFESGDRKFIRSEVKRIIEGMKTRGARYVFGSDHSITTNVDYDDFRYALEVYNEHRNY